jgi:hypothetical protein
MIAFDERARRYRWGIALTIWLATVAAFAMLTPPNPDLPSDWTWPPLIGLIAALGGWRLASRNTPSPPGQERLFGNQPVRMRRGGRNCAIDAEDALHVMYLQPHETALHRLALRYGDENFFQDENGRWWFGQSALLDWLQQKAHEGDPRALRFRRWLEREALPGWRRRPVRT